MILSKLTPAETLLLREGTEATLQDMLKYTLMDLLLKQVLAVENVEKQANPRDPIRTYRYIAGGEKLSGYSGLQHEMVYLTAFRKSSDIRILFRHIVKMAYENAKSEKYFRKSLTASPVLKSAFATSFLHLFTGGVSYTKDGLHLKEQAENEIVTLEKTLAEGNHDKNKVSSLLKVIGGNIFLLKGLEVDLLKEIEDELFKEFSRRPPPNGACSAGCWTMFETYGREFDSSCSASPSGGCSSGDGGCGGGCGGCGGD